MHYRTFLTYNLLGGVLWGTGVTVLGYFLGQISFVRSNIELILIAIVLISVPPIGIQLLRSRRRSATAADATASSGACGTN